MALSKFNTPGSTGFSGRGFVGLLGAGAASVGVGAVGVPQAAAADGMTAATLPPPSYGIVARASEFPVAGSAKPHQAVRVSTHLFHQREDVGRVVDALWQLSGVMS